MSSAGSKREEKAEIAAVGQETATVDGSLPTTQDSAVGTEASAPPASQDDATVEPAVDHRIRNHLGRKLKESYEDLVRQPVPDKFLHLLEELERQEKKQ